MSTAKSVLLKSPASRRAVGLLGRLGYGAPDLMVGVSAGRATLDAHHRPGGFIESLSLFQHHWAGAIVLVLLAIGMACFAGWLAVSAVYRRDHPGRAHYVLVAGMLGDAAIYIGFMGSVLGMVFGASSDGGEHALQSWIGWLLAGLGGRDPGRRLVSAPSSSRVRPPAARPGSDGRHRRPARTAALSKQLMLPIGRFGTGGRGVAIALVGCYVFIAAIQGDASQAHELGGALANLRAQPYGIVVTALFALAFVGSSILDFVIACFRRFNPRRP